MLFSCLLLISFVISNRVAKIGDFDFSDFKSLTDITPPNRITNIDHHVFGGISIKKATSTKLFYITFSQWHSQNNEL